ncbi:hypothetical protein PYCC9005_003780 [Savitreella phatthalungensis]
MSLIDTAESQISIRPYHDETDLPAIVSMISADLSEPYSIYVYRYFIHHWPELCFVAEMHGKPIGTIVSKLEDHRGLQRGYIAMLAVKPEMRGKGIAKRLVMRTLESMKDQADEVCLETEVTNPAAMQLYESLGFIRSKRLHRYYLNANDAFRMILPLRA